MTLIEVGRRQIAEGRFLIQEQRQGLAASPDAAVKLAIGLRELAGLQECAAEIEVSDPCVEKRIGFGEPANRARPVLSFNEEVRFYDLGGGLRFGGKLLGQPRGQLFRLVDSTSIHEDPSSEKPDLHGAAVLERSLGSGNRPRPLLQRNSDVAIAAAERALENSSAVKIRFLAARVFVDAGRIDKAKELAAGLTKQLSAEPQASAKIIEANLFMKAKDWSRAISTLTESNTLLDTWIGHFDLGRAFLESGQFPQADGEFERCIRRRGEALALFLDEEPTFGYLPPAYFYQGQVREAMKSEGFAESYAEYVKIRGNSTEDPLLPDVRRRASR